MSPAPPLLVFAGVERVFDEGRVAALQGVDFSIDAGESVAVVGRSGSGKSTLLHLAAGLDRPDQGKIVFAGRSDATAAEWTRRRRESIGMVFQSFCLLPRLTAIENIEVAMPDVAHRERRQRALGLLRDLGLAGRAGQPQENLSGGEKQRVALARALANRPRLLLADEPTGNLDAANGEAVLAAMLSLVKDAGSALLLVTHDTRLALRCSRQIELLDGRMVRDSREAIAAETPA